MTFHHVYKGSVGLCGALPTLRDHGKVHKNEFLLLGAYLVK